MYQETFEVITVPEVLVERVFDTFTDVNFSHPSEDFFSFKMKARKKR